MKIGNPVLLLMQEARLNPGGAPRISASLEGGYDSDFTATSGSACLNGTITVYNGTVTIEGLVLE